MTKEALLAKPRSILSIIEGWYLDLHEGVNDGHCVRIYEPNLKADLLVEKLLLGLVVRRLEGDAELRNHALEQTLDP